MAKKASENIKTFKNKGGAVITTVSRKIIEKDGLYFKDIDGSGEFKPFDDWRLSPAKRAAEYVKVLSVKEKIAQLFISDWRVGKYLQGFKDHKGRMDESGILDEADFKGRTIFGEQHLPGTSTLLKEWFNRHLIIRANPTVEDLTDWLNQLQAVAEECEHFIPVEVASNSRNENGEIVFGMNDAGGVFATYPGTLGIAAAVLGDDISIADDFADTIRREWNACGLRKGYMYMADVVSDPRWQRTYGTFGEDPELVKKIFTHIIPRIQGSDDGVTSDGVAMTVKHFPGGGARENGFDPHYKMGQWNVYQTKGSLEKYHIPTFLPAVEFNASSIMPYYAKPAKSKSAEQTDLNGDAMEMLPYGFAYNRPFIQKLLREQMGFKGYINSDTGIVHNMSWGVEMLDIPERIGFAVNHAGVDLISGLFDNKEGMEAYERAVNGYYDSHKVPAGFTKEQLVLTDEALNRAVTRTLTELFALGMFDNPFRQVDEAVKEVATSSDWDKAMDVHRKSVVLLKNDGMLPLTEEKLSGKKVYVECFNKDADKAQKATESLRSMLKGSVELAEDYNDADYAVLLLNPSSGAYFSATPGYLELDLCEGKMVSDVDDEGRPLDKRHEETTLSGVAKIQDISKAVRARGGKVFANVNVTLAWQVGSVEPYVDAFAAGFDTYVSAVLDVVFGRFAPVGKLPLTLPRNDEVLAVGSDGVCVSPNDVPGYDKDLYMPDFLKDENGKAYAYRDSQGNYYELGFGLKY